MDTYIYTVKDRETGEILFRGDADACAEFVGCPSHNIPALATRPPEYKRKSRYSMYLVERHSDGNPTRGGERRKDIKCCDCGVLMKNVGANRRRCPECSYNYSLVKNREYMRNLLGIKSPLAPIHNPNSKYCEGCIYFQGDSMRCCNYIFIVGNRRPCPPGKDCTVKRYQNQNK